MMRNCNELLSNLKNQEASHISALNSAFLEFFKSSEKEIKGLRHKLKVVEGLVTDLRNKNVIELDLSHERKVNNDTADSLKEYFKFRNRNTRRFLLFYTSEIYEGNFRVSPDRESLSELSENLKDVYVEIDRTGVIVNPSFQEEETILFRCYHRLLENVYFSIVRFSPKGYKFFFFYNVFDKVCRIDFEKLSNKIELIQNELKKLKLMYSPDKVESAILLKSFQNFIIREEEKFKKDISLFERAFDCLDKIKSIVISSVEEIHSYEKENILTFFKLLNENLRKLNLQSFKGNSFFKFIDKIDEMLKLKKEAQDILRIKEESLKILKEEFAEQRQKFLSKLEIIDNILGKHDFTYEDVKLFQSEIPEISKLGIAESAIADLREIINSYDGITGKIKKLLSSYDKQLKLEEEKIRKLKIKISEALSKLKDKYKSELEQNKLKMLEEKVSTEEKNFQILKDSYEDRINRLQKELKEIADTLCEEIEKEYLRLDNLFAGIKNEYISKQKILEDCYRNFFSQLKQTYTSTNLVKLFSKIEKPYLSAAIEKELLPHDFLKFSEFLKRELSLFEEEVDIKER